MIEHAPLKEASSRAKQTRGGIKTLNFPDVQILALDGTKLGMLTKIAAIALQTGVDLYTAH